MLTDPGALGQCDYSCLGSCDTAEEKTSTNVMIDSDVYVLIPKTDKS